MSKVTTEMTPEEFRDHLDYCIGLWRDERDNENRERSAMAVHYIDAYQCVRVTYFGELLP